MYTLSQEELPKMKKASNISLAISTAAVFAAVLLPGTLAAAASTCGKDSSGTPIPTSIDFGNSSFCNAEGASPITAILLWAISLLGIGVGIAVVVGIIFGGIAYAASDGDAGKAKEGQEIVTNSIIGLFLYIFLYAAANFLIPGGIFK